MHYRFLLLSQKSSLVFFYQLFHKLNFRGLLKCIIQHPLQLFYVSGLEYPLFPCYLQIPLLLFLVSMVQFPIGFNTVIFKGYLVYLHILYIFACDLPLNISMQIIEPI